MARRGCADQGMQVAALRGQGNELASASGVTPGPERQKEGLSEQVGSGACGLLP